MIEVLVDRLDVSFVTVHKVLADRTVFELVSKEERNKANEFFPCYACGGIAHQSYACSVCGVSVREKHRKARGFMKYICLGCSW